MKPDDDSRFSDARRRRRAQFSQEKSGVSQDSDARSKSRVGDAWNKIASDLERIDKLGSEYDDFGNWNARVYERSGNSPKESAENLNSSPVSSPVESSDLPVANASSRDSLRRAARVLSDEVRASSNDDKLSEDYETRNKRRNKSVWDAGDWARAYNEKTPRERSSSYERRSSESRRPQSQAYDRRGDNFGTPPRRSNFSDRRERDEFARRDGTKAPRFQAERASQRRNNFERDENFKPNDFRRNNTTRRSADRYFEQPGRFNDQNANRGEESEKRRRKDSFSPTFNSRPRPNSRRRADLKPTLGTLGKYGEPLSLAEEYAEKRVRRGDSYVVSYDVDALNETRKNAAANSPDNSSASGFDELAALQEKSIYELIEEARRLDDDPRGELVRRALHERVVQAGLTFGEGALEILPDGFGFLRSVETSYLSCSDDVYVSPSQIRRFSLRSGLVVSGLIRPPKERERYFALLRIDTINGQPPASLASTPFFDDLVAARPTRRLKFEQTTEILDKTSQEQFDALESDEPTLAPTFGEEAAASRGRDMRLLDLVLPLGFGQRTLILCPPRSGKTTLIRKMVESALNNYDDLFAYVVLVSKRPEDVTETRRALAYERCEVVGSTFDECNARHVQLVQTVFEKAKRMVEYGKNAVVFLDSTTRFINACRGDDFEEQNMASALQRARKIFASSRQIDGGGSLTVVATCLWNKDDPNSQLELDALQSVSHTTLWLDAELAEKNIWPPINVPKSSARDCKDFVEERERVLLEKIRESVREKNATDAIRELLDKIAQTSSNLELSRALESEI